MDDNQKACVGFSVCGGVGPMTFIKMVTHFGSPHAAYQAPSVALQPFFRTTQNYHLFLAFRSTRNLENEIKKIEGSGVWIMTQWHDDYPQQLKHISDPPICLFGKGIRDNIHFTTDICVGIVGTRKPTSYGQFVARELGEAVAAAGMVIVSGMATGIDTTSHKAAIEKQGRTVAVLGTGIDMVYPYENKDLHDQILAEYGIVVSEYPPGFGIRRGMFVMRNRIIVGLSKAIIVVEGGEHSGSLITARFAAENGVDVYAVPGPITSDMSIGPHILLGEGAKILKNPQEFLRDFGVEQKSAFISPQQINLTPNEKKIFDLLSVKKHFADEVARTITLSVPETLPILSLLEVRGIIEKDLDGGFIVRV